MARKMDRSKLVTPFTPAQMIETLVRIAITDLSLGRDDPFEVDRDQLRELTLRHGDDALDGSPLAAVLANLLSELLAEQTISGLDPLAVAAVVTDELLNLNNETLTWNAHDAGNFVRLVERTVDGDDVRPQLIIWVDEAEREPHVTTPRPLVEAYRAVVLAPMTSIPAQLRPFVAAWGAGVRNELNDLGLVVHAPVATVPLPRDDLTIEHEDVRRGDEAHVIIALLSPPATGVAMLLAYASRSRAHVILMRRPQDPVSPIVAQLSMKAVTLMFTDVEDARTKLSHELRFGRTAERLSIPVPDLAPQLREIFQTCRDMFSSLNIADAPAPLTSRRVEQILATEDGFASATIFELSCLLGWLTEASDGEPSTARPELVQSTTAEIVDPPTQQMTLFDDTPPAEFRFEISALDRLPAEWRSVSWLTSDEVRFGVTAAAGRGLSAEVTGELLDFAAALRCLETADSGRARSSMNLLDDAVWNGLLETLRNQGPR